MMNDMISRTTLVAGLSTAAVAFIGYCVYFDRKRRNDPEYKKKVRERRRQKKKTPNQSEIPNLADHEAVQRFFLQEIQNGESLIAAGDIERGVEHLANAVVVCGQPAQLLQVLQQTLPSQVFSLLVQRMRTLSTQQGPPSMMDPRAADRSLVEDDLE